MFKSKIEQIKNIFFEFICVSLDFGLLYVIRHRRFPIDPPTMGVQLSIALNFGRRTQSLYRTGRR